MRNRRKFVWSFFVLFVLIFPSLSWGAEYLTQAVTFVVPFPPGGRTDLAARKLISSFYNENSDYFLSPELFLEIHRQMIRHIVTVMEGNV